MKKLAFPLLVLLLACDREPARPDGSARDAAPAGATNEATAEAPAPAAARPEPVAPEPIAAPPVAGPKLPFVDEASQDASFVAYREKLMNAVRARNGEAVLDLADPNIRTSFGAEGGRADLARKLDDGEMWQQLETILTMGGSFRGEGAQRSFWAPYVYSTFPDTHDPFETVAVVVDAAPLRESASASAPVIATLSRDLLEGDIGKRTDWMKVKTADGRSGFVESRFVRSSIDYRAGFVKTATGWKMNVLVAGD